MVLMTLKGASGTYRVGNMLAATPHYRVYLATEAGTDRYYLLQVATSLDASGGLDRAAFLLHRLKATADIYDDAYAKDHKRKHLHYDRLYPTIVESFISPEQGGRRINVVSLADVKNVLGVVPLSNLRAKDRLRVDPKTSAWMMGRLLKLLAFVHGEGIANRAISTKNILLDPKQHFAVTFDWTHARMFPDTVPDEYAVHDIADAASAVLAAIDFEAPGHPDLQSHTPYINLLQSFADGKQRSAEVAMDRFYELVRSEYGETFHPFTTLPL